MSDWKVMEQYALAESLHGAGAKKGRTKSKMEQVGAVGGDACDRFF